MHSTTTTACFDEFPAADVAPFRALPMWKAAPLMGAMSLGLWIVGFHAVHGLVALIGNAI